MIYLFSLHSNHRQVPTNVLNSSLKLSDTGNMDLPMKTEFFVIDVIFFSDTINDL